MATPTAVVKKVTPVFDSFLKINEYDIEAETHAGGTVRLTRFVMERGDAVAVLGYDPARDEVVLGNEIRPGILAAGEYPFSDALIAGAVEPGENILAAAAREMKEEADLELRHPEVIHPGAYVSSGGTSERVAIVLGIVDASSAGGVHGNPEEHEDIKTVVLPGDVFIENARRGVISDMKTALAAYWLAEHRSRLRAAALAG